MRDKREKSEDAENIEAIQKDAVESDSVVEKDQVDYKDKYARLLAEYSNFAKQKEAEMASTAKFATKNLATKIIDVLDDIEAGLIQENTSEETRNILSILKSKLELILSLEGIKEISMKPGDTYSSETCEVIQAVEDSENAGKIVQILRKGYMISDRVLRTAKVIVGK